MTADHRELAETFLAMLNSHDPDAVDRFVAVGYINHNAFVGDGREANRAFWAAFFAAFPVTGDHEVIHRGPLFGIPPAGRPAEMRSIDIWRVAGGEFAEHWDELNYLEFFQQLGVIPALAVGGQERQP